MEGRDKPERLGKRGRIADLRKKTQNDKAKQKSDDVDSFTADGGTIFEVYDGHKVFIEGVNGPATEADPDETVNTTVRDVLQFAAKIVRQKRIEYWEGQRSIGDTAYCQEQVRQIKKKQWYQVISLHIPLEDEDDA